MPFQCLTHFEHWEKWSPPKRHYCCAHYGRACDPFDCNEDFQGWKTKWSFAKKAWCCEKTKRACEPHHQHHDVVKVTRHTEYSHGHPIPHDLVTVTKHTEYSYGHPPPHVVKVTRPTLYSHNHPPPPHDVVRVTRHTEYSYGHPHPPDAVRVSHVEYPHHAIETGERTELSGFNCHDEGGTRHWQSSWSSAQSLYCCKHFGLACPFNCYKGHPDSWSDRHRSWCCESSHIGCGLRGRRSAPEVSYDNSYNCDAGFQNWQVGWSAAKKEWCCRARLRGCEQKRLLT